MSVPLGRAICSATRPPVQGRCGSYRSVQAMRVSLVVRTSPLRATLRTLSSPLDRPFSGPLEPISPFLEVCFCLIIISYGIYAFYSSIK